MQRAAYLVERHLGTVGTTAIPIWVGNPTRDGLTATQGGIALTRSMSVLVDNMDDTNLLYVSFDGGTTYKTIRANGNLAVDCNVTSLLIYASGANTSYEILVVYEAVI